MARIRGILVGPVCPHQLKNKEEKKSLSELSWTPSDPKLSGSVHGIEYLLDELLWFHMGAGSRVLFHLFSHSFY